MLQNVFSQRISVKKRRVLHSRSGIHRMVTSVHGCGHVGSCHVTTRESTACSLHLMGAAMLPAGCSGGSVLTSASAGRWPLQSLVVHSNAKFSGRHVKNEWRKNKRKKKKVTLRGEDSVGIEVHTR